ncbi:right-handed parallel beta-helix repeat-containing protein [Haloglomus halophilum]|uniref:right-handed parallel beta-helix repeat-containing protein n=1 Tax=Haloglomus halophilum TaxID=2962672 RepID=UPI0020C9B9F9|nr:right-handed parallel beta-helix repeat-containing protein [Haloglomus halophilum]
MRTRSTLRGGRRTRVALLALALSGCLLVAAFAPVAALSGTVTSVANDGGNTGSGGNTGTDSGGPTTVSECRTIDTAGDYRLDADLAADSGTCIEITASDVSLDGAGYEVTSDADGTGVEIRAGSDGTSNVTVRDLAANGTRDGVLVTGSQDTSDVVGIELVDITSHNNSRAGIRTVFANVTVRKSTLTENEVGLEVLGGAAVVEATDAELNDVTGLKASFDPMALTVTGGAFTENGARGVLVREVPNATLTGVNASNNRFDGILIASTAPNATLRDINASANARHGLVVRAPGVRVLGATASGNGEDGFRFPAVEGSRDARRLLAGETTLEARNNVDAGARLSGSNTSVSGLVATGNAAGVNLTDATGVTVNETDASRNDRGVVFANTSGSVFDEGTVANNSGVGLLVIGSDDNTMEDLTALDNAVTYRAVGNGRTSVDRLTLARGTISFTASDVEFETVARPEPARPGNRTFGPYLNATTTESTSLSTDLTGNLGGGSGFLDLTVGYASTDLENPPLEEPTVRLHAHDGSWSAIGGSLDRDADEVSLNISAPSGVYAPAADLENAITACRGGSPLTEDGATYRVDTDLQGTGSRCLAVSANNVTVVGFGHGGEQPRTITGQDSADISGIDVRPADDRTGVTVRNLTVRDFGVGIKLRGANATLRRVTAFSNADEGILVDGATNATLFNTSAVENGGTTGDGILLRDATDTNLTKVLVQDNGAWGLRETSGTTGTTAEDLNVFADPNDDGEGRNVVLGFEAARDIALGSVAEPAPPGENLTDLGDFVDIEGQQDGAYVELDLRYNDTGVDEGNLSLYDYDERVGEYGPVEGASVHPDADVVSANLTSFSTFAPLVNTSTSSGGSDGDTGDGDTGDGDTGDGDTGDGDTGDGDTGDGDTGDGDTGDGDTGDGDTGGGDEESPPDIGSGTGDGSGDGSDGGSSGGGGGGGSASTQDNPSFATVAASVNRTSVQVGGTVRINATVRNSGDGGGRYEADLYRNDRFVQSRFVELSPGEEAEISFERQPSEVGTYTFRVENVTAGTVNVTGTAPGNASTTPTATPTPAPDDSDTDDGTGGADGDGTATGDGSTDGSDSDDSGSDGSADPGTSENVGAPGSPGDSDGGFGGLGPLGMVVGGIGALAVGAGTIYLVVLKP